MMKRNARNDSARPAFIAHAIGRAWVAAIFCAGLLSLPACSDDNDLEEFREEVRDEAGDAKEDMKDAAEDAKEKAKDAKDEVEDEIDDHT